MPTRNYKIIDLPDSFDWGLSVEYDSNDKVVQKPDPTYVMLGTLLQLRNIANKQFELLQRLAGRITEQRDYRHSLKHIHKQLQQLIDVAEQPTAADQLTAKWVVKATREERSRTRAWQAYLKAGGTESQPGDLDTLSRRPREVLRKLRVTSLTQLSELSAETLLEQRNFGPHALKEVQTFLASFGLTLAPSPKVR